MQASDTTPHTLEILRSTVEELCCQYNRRDALELREEAHAWLDHVGGLLMCLVGSKAHQELLVAGGGSLRQPVASSTTSVCGPPRNPRDCAPRRRRPGRVSVKLDCKDCWSLAVKC